ncbi:MAG TPA: thioesterase family protein [Phnomibacter sp.]|nr:thioesterase family protein [Phnomibacter sp.]
MQRIKIAEPEKYSFSTNIAIRISDVNYGNHVGNDAFLSLAHEARMQYLHSLGLSELSFGAAALIMADAAIEFKAEMYYGDIVHIEVAATSFTKVAFDLVYKMTVESAGKKKLAGLIKTGMICYDYAAKKMMPIPADALQKLHHS